MAAFAMFFGIIKPIFIYLFQWVYCCSEQPFEVLLLQSLKGVKWKKWIRINIYFIGYRHQLNKPIMCIQNFTQAKRPDRFLCGRQTSGHIFFSRLFRTFAHFLLLSNNPYLKGHGFRLSFEAWCKVLLNYLPCFPTR